mmetsp:Transcript_26229/g.32797  ORF Transcript_26229/g.32797 Transcript_26229/m.32797 type:complete len:104 (+) Transcript_26229:2035-2346(+)
MINQHKSASNLGRPPLRSGSNGRGNSISSNGKHSQHEQVQLATFEDMKRDMTNMHSAAGVGVETYNGSGPYGLSSIFDNKNVNRSNSLHERKFNPASDYLRNQ